MHFQAIAIKLWRWALLAILIGASSSGGAFAAPGLDQTLTGGGAQASASGGVQLNGIIDGFGLQGYAISGSASDHLAVGFLPMLRGLLNEGYNRASELWLELTQTLRENHPAMATVQASSGAATNQKP